MFIYHFGAVANQNSFNKRLRVEHCMYLLKFTFIGFQNFIHSVINNHSCLSHKFLKIELYGGKQQLNYNIIKCIYSRLNLEGY